MKYLDWIKRFQGGISSALLILSMSYGAVTWVGNEFDNLATKEDIDHVKEEIDALTGANRVVQFRRGYSYISEPVTVGDRSIRYNAVARRTELGVGCILQTITPLFEDETRAVVSGKALNAPRQLNTTYTPVRPVFDLPDKLSTGRVTVVLQLLYDCNGTPMVENSEPVTFKLME